MKTLVQFNMFGGAPTVVQTFETRPFNMDEWHRSQGGELEEVTAREKMTEARNEGQSYSEPVI